MNNGEGETKQGAKKMALCLFEIRKPKAEKRDMMKYGKGPRTRSHLLLTLPLLYHMSSFLVFYQLKEAEEEKGKGSERGETTRRPF